MGVGCQQNHFPAVAQPFTIFWAPWPLTVGGFLLSFILFLFIALLGFSTIGMMLLPLMILGFHAGAIILGMRMRYIWTILLASECRKTGSNNLGGKGSQEFGNI